MALTPPPQFSGYQPGSLAGRPTVKKGGVRRQGESPEAFGQRMEARYASNQPAAVTPPTREENILHARMNNTFQPTVDAYNKANAAAGKQMNEAGQIVSTSTNLAAGNATGNVTSNASVMPGNAPKGVTPPSPGRYTGPMAAPAQPRKAATFEGKSFAQLTQEGANKYGSAAYGSVRFKGPMAANPAPAAPKPSVTNAPAMVAAATRPPAQVTPPAPSPAPAAPMAVTPPPPAGKPWKPPVFAQMAPPPGLPPNTQQFQTEMQALHQGQKLVKPPGVPAVTPKPGSTAPQPFSAAALGTSQPRAVMPPSFAMLGR